MLAMLATAGASHAETAVTIGALYPRAQGADARGAIETAVEIINTPHAGLEGLPLGAGKGLPNLGGVKLTVTFADDLDNPSVAQAQALRLVTQNHVAALIGAGADAETLAATTLGEHHGVPFLVLDATAPGITGRGYGWVFRTTPLARDIAVADTRFLSQLKAADGKVETIAVVTDETAPEKEIDTALHDALAQAGFASFSLGYKADAADLSPVVQELRRKGPDAIIVHASPTAARLLVTTMNTIGYKPRVMMADDDGFSGEDFIAGAGNLAQGLIDRSVWSRGAAGSPTAVVNDLYRSKTGRDLDDRSAQLMQGVLVLADAINRAGSTDPGAIRDALRGADLKSGQLIVGYGGVKFDATGQNALAATNLTQLQGKRYVTVWPPERATGKLTLPF